MKKILSTIVILLLVLPTLTAIAHSGKTDSNGGHYNRSTGDYHYHHGYPEHYHTNGKCPYDFNDNTSEDETHYAGRITKDDTKTSTTEEEETIILNFNKETSKDKNIMNDIFEFIANITMPIIELIIFVVAFYIIVFVFFLIFEALKKLKSFILSKTAKNRFEFDSYQTKTDKNYKKMYHQRTIPLLLICIFLLLGTISLSFTLDEYKEYKKKYSSLYSSHEDLRSSYDKYVDKYKAVKDEYDFYHEYAVCVEEHDRYYHKYECENFEGEYFWIYNINAAQDKGYKECPVCFPKTEE